MGLDIAAIKQAGADAILLPKIRSADDAITMGQEDLAMETRITHTPDRAGFLFALGACVMTARANGLDIIDGVYTALEDQAGFAVECQQAKKMGFDGKSLVHPRQVDICNHCFSPAEEEVRWAKEIVSAWDEQKHIDQAVVVVNGRMVEHLHVTEARRVLGLDVACK